MIALALVAIVALSLVLDIAFTDWLSDASFATAAMLSVATLAPVGFLMGMPFPLGLRLLDRVGPQWAQMVPWVWGINGAASVLGSVLAISIALNLGFRVTMIVGLCVYGVAFATAGYLAGGSIPARERLGVPACAASRGEASGGP